MAGKLCRQLRDVIQAAEPEIEETIKRRVQRYFMPDGHVCALSGCTGEASVTELAAPFQMSQPAISKHLKVLQKAGLIFRGRNAQRRPCWLEAKPLRDATAWLADFRLYWEESYQRLDVLLEPSEGRAIMSMSVTTPTSGSCSPAASSPRASWCSTPTPNPSC